MVKSGLAGHPQFAARNISIMDVSCTAPGHSGLSLGPELAGGSCPRLGGSVRIRFLQVDGLTRGWPRAGVAAMPSGARSGGWCLSRSTRAAAGCQSCAAGLRVAVHDSRLTRVKPPGLALTNTSELGSLPGRLWPST